MNNTSCIIIAFFLLPSLGTRTPGVAGASYHEPNYYGQLDALLLPNKPDSDIKATVDIPQDVKDTLHKFRFAKRSSASGSAAIVIKINREKLKMEVEDQYDDVLNVRELAEELPESSPRYVVFSYELKHADGRVSFPLVLINWCPSGSEPRMLTLHASSLVNFQNTVDIGKVIEIRDGPDSLTQEAIDSKLTA